MAIEDLPIINTEVDGVNIFKEGKEFLNRYKFIQFYLGDQAYLRVGATYHKDILIGFLDECNQAGLDVATAEYIDELKRLDPQYSYHRQEGNVLFDTDKYKIAGAGHIFIVTTFKEIKFDSRSMFLDIGIDRRHVEAIKQYLPQEMTVEIGM